MNEYTWQPGDIIQRRNRDGTWSDLYHPRTVIEATDAQKLVDTNLATYRIARPVTVYPVPTVRS